MRVLHIVYIIRAVKCQIINLLFVVVVFFFFLIFPKHTSNYLVCVVSGSVSDVIFFKQLDGIDSVKLELVKS